MFSPPASRSLLVNEMMFAGVIVLAYACSIPRTPPIVFTTINIREYATTAIFLNKYGLLLFCSVGRKKFFTIV